MIMELTWMDDFLALEQTRNFTRASEMRHTTQSAYSRRIARLEDWLGARLFERDSRPVRLTPQGQEFLTRARAIRADILDARRALQVLGSNYEQSLRLYTTNTLAVGFLPGFLKTALARPTTVLVASTTGCLESLTAGRCDQMIVPSFPGDTWPEQFNNRVVGQDKLVLVASPKIAAQIAIQKHKLMGPMMMYTPGVRYGQMVNDVLARHHLTLDAPPLCESASAEALAAQVAAGLGAAFIPEMLVNDAMVVCAATKKLVAPYDIVAVG
jgi:DNA-binding transcriptional LysR family regulator